MLTKNDLYKAGLRPTNDFYTAWGSIGTYAHAIPYIDNKEEFHKVEIRQDPVPPGTTTAEAWTICFTYEHLVEVIKSFTYYQNSRKVAQNSIKADSEIEELYAKCCTLFNITWQDFLELPLHSARALTEGFEDWA